MAESVVRNANKDIPIFDSSTDYGDQYLMDNQNIDDMGPDEIIRMLEEDPYALDPLDQDTTSSPEIYLDPEDEIRRRILEFGGSESEGGLADPSGILSAPQSDKVYMREGGLAMLGQITSHGGSGPLDSYRQFLSEVIDQNQVEPFIDEIHQMASERFNLGGGNTGGQSVFGPMKIQDMKAKLTGPPITGIGISPTMKTDLFPNGFPKPQDYDRPQPDFTLNKLPLLSNFGPDSYSLSTNPALASLEFQSARPTLGVLPEMTYEQALGRQQQRDLKSPEENARIQAALAKGPSDPNAGSPMQGIFNIPEEPRLFADGGGVSSLMKKTTVEMQEVPADRNMLVMNRIMKQGGVTQSRDPRLMAQLAQVLGRDG